MPFAFRTYYLTTLIFFVALTAILYATIGKTDIPININVLRYLQTGIGDNDFVKRGNSYLSYILNEFLGIKINPMYFGDISYGE